MATKKQLEPVAPAADKEKALANALSQIEKQFGKGSVMQPRRKHRHARSSTSRPAAIGLDLALGMGGLPRGRIIEIYGPESSGKTTLALHSVAEAQKMGGTAAFIDAEHALDPVYAQGAGRGHRRACASPSRTTASRRWTSQRRSCARARSTSLLSTRLPRWSPSAEIEGEMGESRSSACRRA